MTLGPRSACLGEVRVGGEWAAAEIVLPPAYHDDLSRLELHPSLMDIATGFVNMHLSPEFRMPLAYARIRVNRPVPARSVSHVRTREGADAATYDVVLTDSDGRVVVEIEGLTMKRPVDLAARLAALAEGRAADVPAYQPEAGHPRRAPAVLVGAPGDGLTPEEATAAFARILHQDLSPQVVVAPRPIDVVAAERGRSWDVLVSVDASARGGRPAEGRRPALMTEYVAPRSDLERDLVSLWEQLLGPARIGIHDRFADLGGHSLFAVRLASLIRERHHVDLPLADVLATPTVARLAELIIKARTQQST
jgi:hypothetical protein